MNTLEFLRFCMYQHDVECNQKYDGARPYSFHLNQVVEIAERYLDLLDPKDHINVIKACAGHDLIEDARVSYNDILANSNLEVAEIIFLCTENKGRNRAARKSKEFYTELATNRLAVFVKLCDIIANTNHSYNKAGKSSMYEKYKAEWPKVKEYIYTVDFIQMFDALDKLHATNRY